MKNELKFPPDSILSKAILIILTGLPSSGKSTFTTELKNQLNSILSKLKINNQVDIIDTDTLRIQRFGSKFHPENESLVRESVLREVEEKLGLNKIVISDDINYYVSMRHELVTKSVELKTPYFIIFISTPLNVCLKWNQERIPPLDDEIIIQISEKFDIPGYKYKWDEPFRIINLSNEDLTKSCQLLVKDITNFRDMESFKKKSLISINGRKKFKDSVEDTTKKILYLYSNYIKNDKIMIEIFKSPHYLHERWLEKDKNIILQIFEENLKLLKIKFGNSIGEMNKKRKLFVKNYLADNHSLKNFILDFLEFLLNA